VFSLSDSELDVIMNLAQPLDPAMRDPFLRAVAAELRRYRPEDIGPGAVFRTAKALQRRRRAVWESARASIAERNVLGLRAA
jgi:hypothetical protein